MTTQANFRDRRRARSDKDGPMTYRDATIPYVPKDAAFYEQKRKDEMSESSAPITLVPAVPTSPPPIGPPPDAQTTITVELNKDDLTAMLAQKETMLSRATMALNNAQKSVDSATADRDNTAKLLASANKGVIVYARAMMLS